MATVTSFTANMSGVVSYANNNVGSFGVWYDSASEPQLVGSPTVFCSLFHSKNAVLVSLFNALHPVMLTYTTPSTTDVVSAFTMVISGNVAYSDNTVMSFSFEVRDNDSVLVHINGGNVTLDNVASVTSLNAVLTSMFSYLLAQSVTVTA